MRGSAAKVAASQCTAYMLFLQFFRILRSKQLWLQLWLPVAAAVCCAWAQAAPRTPTQDSEVLERLPFRAGDTTARELSTLRAAVAKSPTDTEPAVALAQRYFDLAVARGDPRYVGYADAIITRFAAKPTADTLMMRGMLRQYRHDFQPALEDFAAALALDADLAGANAWRGAIYLVQANYVAATQECAALQAKHRVVLHGGCAGLAQAYTGHLADAYKTLQQVLSVARDDDHKLWLNTRLGEIATWQGRSDLAERHYRQAMELGIDDGYLLAAWSDFLLDHGRPAEVVQLLASWEASDPLLLRLAEAETMLKQAGGPAHVQALDDRFAAAKLRGDTTHQAEEARFYLGLRGDAPRAVLVAAENYHVQREPRDARILLEAALASKQIALARPVLDWLQSSGFEGVELRRLAKQFPIGESTGVSAPQAAKAGGLK